MDSKVNYAIVGFFMIILSITLVVSILWLSIGAEKKDYQTYQVYIQESVSGLNRKAVVKYRGLEVGYVRDITLVIDRPNEVRVLLDVEQNVPIKQDTLVVLSIQGLTGLAHIELTGGSHDAPLLVRKNGQKYPELKTKPSLLLRLDTATSALLKNLNNVSGTANNFLNNLNPDMINNVLFNLNHLFETVTVLLSEQNILAVTKILHNFEMVSDTLVARTGSIEKALDNVLKTTENLNKITNEVITLLTQLENSLAAIEKSSNAFARIADTIKETADAFKESTTKVNKVVKSIGETTNMIGKTAQKISFAILESRRDMDYFTRQALPEVTNSLRELQTLLNTLRNFAQELERKPNMLLFGK